MKAMYRKELSSLFFTLNGYIYIFFTLLFSGIFLTVFNIYGSTGDFVDTVSMISYIFLLSVPMLTMKCYPREKELGTDISFSTLPVSRIKIALSKYLALLTVFGCSLGFICLFPLFISINGGGDLAWALCSVFGLFLFGAFLLSMGAFISSLSSSQTTSAIITFTVLLFVYLSETLMTVTVPEPLPNFIIILLSVVILGYVCYIYCRSLSISAIITLALLALVAVLYTVDSTIFYQGVSKIISFISFSRYFNIFAHGVFTIQGTVFYLLFTLLFIILSTILPQNNGVKSSFVLPEHVKQVKKNNQKSSGYYLVVGLLCAAITVGINLIFALFPSTLVNLDVTSYRYHTISQTGERIISSVSSPVTVYHLSSKDNYDSDLAMWLDNLAKSNRNLSVVYVDTELYPEFQKSFTDTSLANNSIIITADHGSEVIRNQDLYLYGIAFMDTTVASELNYDSALTTYNAYIESYFEDYGVDVSGYIAYYPTHHIREKTVISAILNCCRDTSYTNLSEITPISITLPPPSLSQGKQALFSVIFSVALPSLPLLLGFLVVGIRKKSRRPHTNTQT